MQWLLEDDFFEVYEMNLHDWGSCGLFFNFAPQPNMWSAVVRHGATESDMLIYSLNITKCFIFDVNK